MLDIQARLREGESETARAIRDLRSVAPLGGDGGQLTRDFLMWLGLRLAVLLASGWLAYEIAQKMAPHAIT